MAGPKIYHKVNQRMHKTISRHKTKCVEVKIELHAAYKIEVLKKTLSKQRLFVDSVDPRCDLRGYVSLKRDKV